MVARKPLAAGTVAANVLAHGTGALNIEAGRVGTSKQVPASPARLVNGTALSGSVDGSLRRCTGDEGGFDPAVGRWPANVVLAHSEGCRLVGERRVASDGHFPVARGASGYGAAVEGSNGGGLRGQAGLEERFFAGELVEVWECVGGCAVRLLDEQTGELVSGANPTRRGSDKFRGVYGDFAGQEDCKPSRGVDVGGASRFFYTAKASRAERNAGLREGLPRARRRRKRWQQDAADRWWPRASNSHPTVKPVDLMRWLVRLVTPPGGVVLDPFAGSGTTGCAATLEGFRFIGVERDAEYVRIARARIGWWAENPAGMPTVRILSAAVARPAPEQQSLWAALG